MSEDRIDRLRKMRGERPDDADATKLAVKPYLQTVALDPAAQIDFSQYPYNIPAIRGLGQLAFHPDITFLVGENGAGKSTLLEGIALALGFSREGGNRNFNLSTAQSESSLHEVLKLRQGFRKPADGYFLRAESFYNVATYMDTIGYLGGYGGKSLHARSHGEAFMTLLTHKFRGQGLYLLDEPEAALSPSRQLAALRLIRDLIADASQFIIATHSPILLAYPGAKILLCDGSGITEVAYEDTEHYAITRDFLNHYPRRLEQLFSDE
jgi:predicted ATPase